LTASLKSSKISYGGFDLNLGDFLNSIKSHDPIESDANTLYYRSIESIERSLVELRDEKHPRSKIVVFIDDLDRCTPQKALEVLDSIKSFFDIEGIVYIIGMDYKVIDDLIKRKFGRSSTINGFEYMQKLVQLPFEIPEWTERDILQ
jgi:hypothetical protein